jgi:hypothetical protein
MSGVCTAMSLKPLVLASMFIRRLTACCRIML